MAQQMIEKTKARQVIRQTCSHPNYYLVITLYRERLSLRLGEKYKYTWDKWKVLNSQMTYRKEESCIRKEMICQQHHGALWK
jgi:hypothetical protein